MVNTTELIGNIDINKSSEYVSYLSKSLSGEIINFLASRGIEVSMRWISLLILFLSLGIIWIAMKISKPIVKWALIILALLLIGGLLVPWW